MADQLRAFRHINAGCRGSVRRTAGGGCRAPDRQAQLRDGEEARPRTIPRESWSFARLEARRIVPDPNHIYLTTGFEPGRIYEVIYTTTGAPVIGLGLPLLTLADPIAHGLGVSRTTVLGPFRFSIKLGQSVAVTCVPT
jgi:hypothetical protein